MKKEEIALQLTLAVIEKGGASFGMVDQPQTVGGNLAELYNTVLKKLDVQ